MAAAALPGFRGSMDYGFCSFLVVCLGSKSLRMFCEPLVIVTLVNWDFSRKINSHAGDGFVILQKTVSKSTFASTTLPKLFLNVWLFAI